MVAICHEALESIGQLTLMCLGEPANLRLRVFFHYRRHFYTSLVTNIRTGGWTMHCHVYSRDTRIFRNEKSHPSDSHCHAHF